MQNIYHRTSVRKYTEDRVERSRIMQILRAAMAAPSAGNQQPWEFFVVRDPETIRKLSEASPYAGCAAGANVVIVSAYREDVQMPEYAQIDMSIAMENLWLETDAQGLGGVWLGIAPIEERMQKVEEILGMRKGLRAFALFPLGYYDEEQRQQDRFDGSRIHFVEEPNF